MFGFPFQAEIIEDSIYYMGEEHALGHMAVELMNSIGDSDLLLHVTAARFPINLALDAMQMSCLDEAPFTAVRQYLLWQLEALAQLPPFQGMDTAAEQAQITELFSPETAKQIQAWQKLQAELTANDPTEAQIRHILSLPNAPEAHPGKALFDAATEYLHFCLELLDDLADADWCFRPFIRCVKDLESFKVDKLAGLAGKLFRKTGFSARTEYEIRTYEDDGCDVVRIMEFSNYRSLLMTDFFEGIQWNHYPRHCPVCGRVFLMEKAYHQKYCTGNAPLELTGGRVYTCADWALRKESGFQKEAAEASEVKHIYKNTTGSIRKYKSLGTITAEQSEAAKRLAEEKRDDDSERTLEETISDSSADPQHALAFCERTMGVTDAFQELQNVDRDIVSLHLQFCERCATKQDRRQTFQELALRNGLRSPKAAENHYRKALDQMALQLFEGGRCHLVRLRRLKQTARTVTYAYLADEDGEWGEIRYDRKLDAFEVMKLADWDLTLSQPFAEQAKRAIQKMAQAQKLANEALVPWRE